MTQEELDFLYITHHPIYVSQKQGWVRNLTSDVFNGFKDIHEKYIRKVIGNNYCTSCMLNMVKSVYFYADKYKQIKSNETSNIEENVSIPVSNTEEHQIVKKPKKKK